MPIWGWVMTKPIRRTILILALMAAFVLCACDESQVNHWNRADGSTCYSTVQRGCLDALMGWEEE